MCKKGEHQVVGRVRSPSRIRKKERGENKNLIEKTGATLQERNKTFKKSHFSTSELIETVITQSVALPSFAAIQFIRNLGF